MPITIRKFLIGSEQISNGAVYGTKIANDAIGSQHLANDAVSYAAQIKDGIIGYAELTSGLQGSLGVAGPDSIGTTQLKEPSVGSSQLYSPAVGSQNIYNGAVYGTKIANDAVGSQHLANNAVSYAAQIKDGIIGYAELTSGLQGSFRTGRTSPYAGDDSEITITGDTPGTIKTASILKNSYINPIGSILIAAQLKTDVGTYTMRVQLGTVHKVTLTGTDTIYRVFTGSIGVGAESDDVLVLNFMLVNSRAAGVSSNKLLDIYTIAT
jgi:hypothetical protein